MSCLFGGSPAGNRFYTKREKQWPPNVIRTLRLTPSTLRVGAPVAAGRPVRKLSPKVYPTGRT